MACAQRRDAATEYCRNRLKMSGEQSPHIPTMRDAGRLVGVVKSRVSCAVRGWHVASPPFSSSLTLRPALTQHHQRHPQGRRGTTSAVSHPPPPTTPTTPSTAVIQPPCRRHRQYRGRGIISRVHVTRSSGSAPSLLAQQRYVSMGRTRGAVVSRLEKSALLKKNVGFFPSL